MQQPCWQNAGGGPRKMKKFTFPNNSRENAGLDFLGGRSEGRTGGKEEGGYLSNNLRPRAALWHRDIKFLEFCGDSPHTLFRVLIKILFPRFFHSHKLTMPRMSCRYSQIKSRQKQGRRQGGSHPPSEGQGIFQILSTKQ